MGKISKFAATAGFVFVVAGSIASADIKNTGAGSTNTETNTKNNSVVCINNNVVSSTTTSTQTSTSGGASNTGNTKGGSATSGSASNTNSSNVTVTVNGSCPAGTTPAPANSPAAKAAAAGQTNLKFDTKGNLLLPATGTNDTVKLAAMVLAAAAAVALISQFGLSLYRKAVTN